MRFKGLDLNLLVALDTLLELRSISRAAEKLHLSQPAMSAALGRLRDHLKDPVLVASGKKMVPTPYALWLRPMLGEILQRIDGMVSASAVFDPATTQRRFRVGTSDYLSTVLFTRLMPALETTAPHIGLEIIQPTDGIVTLLEQGEIDLLLTPVHYVSPNHPAELLFTERYVVAGWSGNPAFARGITEEAFFASGHIAVEIGRLNRTSFAEATLHAMGKERRVEIVVSSFSLVPEMLVNTRRLAVMHERLARHFAAQLPILFTDMPFDFPVMREMVQFHRSREADVGLRWFIDQIRRAADLPLRPDHLPDK